MKKEKEKYLEGIGRRKTSVARVRIWPEKKQQGILINKKPYQEYFPVLEFQKIIEAPLREIGLFDKLFVTVKAKGGGIRGQTEAIRLGLSRALVKMNPEFKGILKKKGFLTRDARVVERKKYGLRKARRAQQWRKR